MNSPMIFSTVCTLHTIFKPRWVNISFDLHRDKRFLGSIFLTVTCGNQFCNDHARQVVEWKGGNIWAAEQALIYRGEMTMAFDGGVRTRKWASGPIIRVLLSIILCNLYSYAEEKRKRSEACNGARSQTWLAEAPGGSCGCWSPRSRQSPPNPPSF